VQGKGRRVLNKELGCVNVYVARIDKCVTEKDVELVRKKRTEDIVRMDGIERNEGTRVR